VIPVKQLEHHLRNATVCLKKHCKGLPPAERLLAEKELQKIETAFVTYQFRCKAERDEEPYRKGN